MLAEGFFLSTRPRAFSFFPLLFPVLFLYLDIIVSSCHTFTYSFLLYDNLPGTSHSVEDRRIQIDYGVRGVCFSIIRGGEGCC